MKDKHINSLQGCLMDYAYANETDWNTFNELVEKATAYDSQAVQNTIECDMIERKLLSGCNRVYWHINDNEKMEFGGEYLLTIDDRVISNRFMGKTKLEALTKALEWSLQCENVE